MFRPDPNSYPQRLFARSQVVQRNNHGFSLFERYLGFVSSTQLRFERIEVNQQLRPNLSWFYCNGFDLASRPCTLNFGPLTARAIFYFQYRARPIRTIFSFGDLNNDRPSALGFGSRIGVTENSDKVFFSLINAG